MITISEANQQLEKIEEVCQQIQDTLETYAKSTIIFSRHDLVYHAEFYCDESDEVISFKSRDPEAVRDGLCNTILKRYELTNLEGCEMNVH